MEIYINNNLIASNVKLNATTYITENKIENFPSIFTLKVTDGNEIVEEKENCYVTAHYETQEGWYLCFGQLSDTDYQIQKQQAQIEYIALMEDIELE